jgi:hypothetical protein
MLRKFIIAAAFALSSSGAVFANDISPPSADLSLARVRQDFADAVKFASDNEMSAIYEGMLGSEFSRDSDRDQIADACNSEDKKKPASALCVRFSAWYIKHVNDGELILVPP